MLDRKPRIVIQMRLSLIIPTRERAATLEHCLRASLATDDRRLQVVVSDNCSQDNTREVVEKFSDDRLVYVRTPERVSMRQNFEFALTHADGDYIIYIGDDDAFLAFDLPKLLALIEKLNADAIYWDPPTYLWPGVDTTKPTNRMVIRKDQYSGRTQRIDVPQVARDLERCGPRHHLGPKIYHGCVSRGLLDEITRRAGHPFGGSNPDLYVQIAASFLSGNYYSVGYPFTINGTSGASHGFSNHSSCVDQNNLARQQFGQEIAIDPVQDVIPGQMPSIPMYQFATLITVVRDFGLQSTSIDHDAWFEFIARHARTQSAVTQKQVAHILQDFASRIERRDLVARISPLTRAELDTTAQQPDRMRPQVRLMKSYVKPGKIIFDPSAIGDPTVFGASKCLQSLVSKPNSSSPVDVGTSWYSMQAKACILAAKSAVTVTGVTTRQ